MDTPENYYAILGVPMNADSDTLKRAYRQLARRYHPDVAGPGGAIEMKRINRAYAVLGDPEKRHNYDTIMGGVIDLRRGSVRPRPQPHVFNPEEDRAFSGLNIFSTKGPFQAGSSIHTSLGVISALCSVPTVQGQVIAAGSLDGKGIVVQVTKKIEGQDEQVGTPVNFATDPALTIESLRELRFSNGGTLLAGWGRLGLNVWDAYHGTRLWSYSIQQRAVSAHYSLDAVLSVAQDGSRQIRMALPVLGEDTRFPRAWGVRGTDIVSHTLGRADAELHDLLVCTEEHIENRHFWAIRLRTLAYDAGSLITLSCAHVPNEQQEMAVVRRWDLHARTRLGKPRPQITSAVLVGNCVDCTAPYAAIPNGGIIAFAYRGSKIRICNTNAGTYSEILSGTIGSSAKIVLSPDAHWIAVAREDSEINEGVIDLWSTSTGQIIQKFYHPWQISALHFAEKQLIVALTDGTIQIWE